jgi:hypothetical protein
MALKTCCNSHLSIQGPPLVKWILFLRVTPEDLISSSFSLLAATGLLTTSKAGLISDEATLLTITACILGSISSGICDAS